MNRVAVYSITRDRLDITRKSFKMLRQWAGCEFDFYVADNGSDREMRKYLREEKAKGNIHTLILNEENMGQNIAANALLDSMVGGQYRWVMRWDNDALPRTRRFLKKLISVGERLFDEGALGVLSPRISRLKAPPQAKGLVDLGGRDLELVEILGGICRLHPAVMFDDWRFSKFAPLGYGEAAEIAELCAAAGVHMVRVPWLEIEHAHGEDGQIEKWPDEFTWEKREVGRYVSYGL